MVWSTRRLEQVFCPAVGRPPVINRRSSGGGSRSLRVVHELWTREGFTMMSRLQNAVVNFLVKEDGPTAVEYAVMLALIIVVCIAAITTLGQNANQTFQGVGNAIGSTSS